MKIRLIRISQILLHGNKKTFKPPQRYFIHETLAEKEIRLRHQEEDISNSAERFSGAVGTPEPVKIRLFREWEGYSDVFEEGKDSATKKLRKLKN